MVAAVQAKGGIVLKKSIEFERGNVRDKLMDEEVLEIVIALFFLADPYTLLTGLRL